MGWDRGFLGLIVGGYGGCGGIVLDAARDGGYDPLRGERNSLTVGGDLRMIGCFFDGCWDGFAALYWTF